MIEARGNRGERQGQAETREKGGAKSKQAIEARERKEEWVSRR
jgi:hypothetical protein